MNKELTGKERDTNIELLRVILMILVIMHHYVVNSGIVFFDQIDSISQQNRSFLINTVIAQILGAWGKTAINAFVLITGYYMCNRDTCFRKFLRILGETAVYNVLINGLFLIFHYYPYGKTALLKGLFSVGILEGLAQGNDAFISWYLVLLLLIPYINRMLQGIERDMHRNLILILLVLYTCLTTFSLGRIDTFSALGCYIMIYLIGAYLRMHKCRFDSKHFGIVGLLGSCVLFILYVLLSDWLKIRYGMPTGGGMFPVDRMNKLLSVLGAVSLFLLFKGIKIRYSRVINTIASTTLGILLIHTNSDTMRAFLWRDLLKVADTQHFLPLYFTLRLLMVSITVYLACSVIDFARKGLGSVFLKLSGCFTGDY